MPDASLGRRDFRHSFGIEPSRPPPTRSSSSRRSPRARRAASTPTSSTPRRASSSRSTARPACENPFFLALSPDRKFLYSIHAKQFGGKENEQVAAYQVVGRTGELKLLNRQSAEGTAACYLDVDKTGKAVLVANYSSGSVASLPVKADGSLGEPASFFQHKGSSVNPQRQKEPHAHCIVVSPDNRYAFAADLGTDQILCYKLDPATAKLTPNKPPFAKTPAGAGPRHLTFHPNGKRVYVINELLNSVTVFDYDADAGTLTEKQTISTLPDDFKGTSYCADLKITPDGRYLYGTNRGHDSIACLPHRRRREADADRHRAEPREGAAEPGDHAGRGVAALREHAGEQRGGVPDRPQDRAA